MSKKQRSQPVCEFSPEMLEQDPSFNARQVINDAVKRLNDLAGSHAHSNHALRKADERLRNFRFKAVRDREKLIEKHNKELRESEKEIRVGEKERLSSIRQVDQTNAAATAASLAASLQTFDTTARTNAENLRNTLIATAATVAKDRNDLAQDISKQQAIRDENTNKRFITLEQSSYVGFGKDAVTDPLLDKMIKKLDFVADKMIENKGKSDVTDPIQEKMVETLGIIAEKMAENKGNKVGSATTNEWILRLLLAALAAAAYFG